MKNDWGRKCFGKVNKERLVSKIEPFMKIQSRSLLLVSGLAMSFFAKAQGKPGESTQDLADKLSSPVSNLISLPLQSNLDYGIGQLNGSKYTINAIDPILSVFNKDSNF